MWLPRGKVAQTFPNSQVCDKQQQTRRSREARGLRARPLCQQHARLPPHRRGTGDSPPTSPSQGAPTLSSTQTQRSKGARHLRVRATPGGQATLWTCVRKRATRVTGGALGAADGSHRLFNRNHQDVCFAGGAPGAGLGQSAPRRGSFPPLRARPVLQGVGVGVGVKAVPCRRSARSWAQSQQGARCLLNLTLKIPRLPRGCDSVADA